MTKYLGVEIGGTKQQIALGTSDGKVLKKLSTRLGRGRAAEDILAWLWNNIRELIETEPEIRSIGVGFGGPLESATGRVLSSLQVPGWENFRLKEWFEDAFQLPTTVLNDTVAGGLAELKCGVGRGSNHFFYTNIGTGIGGALYVRGKNYDGFGYGSSYLGNSLIPDWTKREAGSTIRLELICSGKSIEERLNRKEYVPKDSKLNLIRESKTIISAADLAKAAKEGDIFSREEIERIADSFAIGLANVLALEAPMRIAVGGGVAKMGSVLFDALRRRTKAYVFVINQGKFEILQAKLIDDAVIVGAILASAEEMQSMETVE